MENFNKNNIATTYGKQASKAAGNYVYDNRQAIGEYAYQNKEVIAQAAYDNREYIAQTAYDNQDFIQESYQQYNDRNVYQGEPYQNQYNNYDQNYQAPEYGKPQDSHYSDNNFQNQQEQMQYKSEKDWQPQQKANYTHRETLYAVKSQSNFDNQDSNTEDQKGSKGILINIDDIKCNDGNMWITIKAANSSKENGKGHTVYDIVGQDSVGEINIIRRYREFLLLHDLLFARYPGLYIPPIPAKNYKDGKTDAVIQERKLHLDLFLKSICQQKYLAKTPELQVFLRPSSQCQESLNSLPKMTTTNVVQYYTNNLPIKGTLDSYSDQQINQFVDQIREFIKLQTVQIKQLRQFKAYSSQIVPMKEQELRYYKQFTEFLGQYEEGQTKTHDATRVLGGDLGVPFKIISGNGDLKGQLDLLNQQLQNPFKHIMNWTKGELMNLESLISAIGEKEACTFRKQKAIKNLKTSQEELAKIQQGKFMFKTLLKTKSGKEQIKLNLVESIQQLERDIDNWDLIKKYLSIYIAEVAIPMFKQRINAGYKVAIVDFSTEEAQNAQRMLACWQNFKNYAQQV